MPDYLRALVFVLSLGGLIFAVTAKPLSFIAGRQRILAWFGIWVVLNVGFFLTRNFWLILLVSGIILLIAQKWETDKMILYLLAFCMVPATVISVPGLGGIENLMALSFQGYLALLLLVPVLLSASKTKSPFGKVPWIILMMYFGLISILTLRETTPTDTLRIIFGLSLSMLVPYLACSTVINTEAKMKSAIYAMIFVALSLVFVGVFETAKHWHVYHPAFASWAGASYGIREGYLRASGPMLDTIPFGTLFMTAIGLSFALPKYLLPTSQRALLFALLLVGLISPFARGPWLGTVIIILVFLLTGPNPVGSLLKFAAIGTVGIFLLLLTPVGDRLINLLPYVGSVESTVTAEYREKLLENSWIAIQRNPLLGSVDYLQTPEMQELIQGQGIIDVVNTYLGVALEYGLVGLGLFVLFFAVVLAGLVRAFWALPEAESELRRVARALFATLCGLLATIFTVSSVGHIPYFYWLLAGLCVAQTRIIMAHLKASRLLTSTKTTSERPSPVHPNPVRRPNIPVRRAPSRGRILRG